MASDVTEFDMGAAWFRRANSDMKAFLEGLAVRLEGALPGRVTVDRKRDGLFSRESHVARIDITLDNSLYSIEANRGHATARRSKIVRGITIKSEQVPIPEWLNGLIAEIRALGELAGGAHAALHDFLMS
jgi:hypothetical protein